MIYFVKYDVKRPSNQKFAARAVVYSMVNCVNLFV